MADFYARYSGLFGGGGGGGGGAGDVVGPGSSTDNAVARFDGITGKIIQNSTVIVDDSGNTSGVGNFGASGTATVGQLIDSGLTANTVPYANASKQLTSSAVTPTQLSYVDATSSIQTQLNSKQASGNYITALTGDVAASGPGSAAATLATVNASTGSFGAATAVPTFTVNAKGLITAASNVSIQIAESQVTNLVTDLAGKQATGNYITALTGDGAASGPGSAGLTLSTVNANVGSFGSASSVATFSVNAKGLTTAAGSASIQIAESQVTNLVTDLAGKQATGNYITALTGDISASGPGSAATTLATVNSNVGSFTNASITVNAKGLITAASSGSGGGGTLGLVCALVQTPNAAFLTNAATSSYTAFSPSASISSSSNYAGISTASLPSTVIPGIKVSSMVAGTYRVTMVGGITSLNNTNFRCAATIYDGTTYGQVNAWTNGSTSEQNSGPIVSLFTYATTQTNLTFQVVVKAESGTGKSYQISSAFAECTFIVERVY